MINIKVITYKNKRSFKKELKEYFDFKTVSQIIENYNEEYFKESLNSEKVLLADEIKELNNKEDTLKNIDFETLYTVLVNNMHVGDHILIEYPYSDRDYLSTYYTFFAKKYIPYSKNVFRVHFFDKEDHYFGFITIRPGVSSQIIGKSYLDPSYILSDEYKFMYRTFKIHLFEEEMYIPCFPWMKQQTDIAVCSHVCIWETVKYYSTFNDYSDATIGKIVEVVEYNKSRKIPSTGLTLQQVSKVLEHYQFSPLIGNKIYTNVDKASEHSLTSRRSFFAYLESGIPVICLLDSLTHSIVAIGRNSVLIKDKDNFVIRDDGKETNKNLIDNYLKSNQDCFMISDLINEIIVLDDNYINPYRVISNTKCDKNKLNTKEKKYSISTISNFIVPLYKHMYYTYESVQARFKYYLQYLAEAHTKAIDEEVIHFPDHPFVRIYLSSSNTIKQHMLENSNNNVLNEKIRLMNMPRFVWNIDISSYDDFCQDKTTAKMILDSTANELDDHPWLLIHDSNYVEYWNNETKTFSSKKIAGGIASYANFYNLKNINEME